mmetsp:Transcript_44353/g.128335  ORF Transcript_44353/g.128335 Transcript_44353/m.128335 type:complete len:203 (-) Transcript_44353:7-615(-)
MLVTIIVSVVFLTEVWLDLCFDARVVLYGAPAEREAFGYYRAILGSPHVTFLNAIAVPVAYREALAVLAAASASLPRKPWQAPLQTLALTVRSAGFLKPWGWAPPQPVPKRLQALATRVTVVNVACSLAYGVVCLIFYVPIALAATFDRSLFASWWVVVYFRILIVLCYGHHVLGCAAWLLSNSDADINSTDGDSSSTSDSS